MQQPKILSIFQNAVQQTYPSAALYILAMPIGNMCDISFRALYVLSFVNAVACENINHTRCILSRYGIKQQFISANKHNEHAAAQKIIHHLQQSERIALVSDAGTPGISDPGSHIIKLVRAAGLAIIPIPGPSAAITALSISDFIDNQFYFVGFLPNKTILKNSILDKLTNQAATLIFYEAPHRIIKTINILLQTFGPHRRVILARELTKQFETIHYCTLTAAIDWLASNTHLTQGEFVILVEGTKVLNDTTKNETERILQILLTELTMKQAIILTAKITHQKRNMLYAHALQIKNSTKNLTNNTIPYKS